MVQDQVIAWQTERYDDWLTVLDALGVRFLALDVRRDSGLLQAARLHPEWTVDFEGQESMLFARTPPPAGAGGTA